MRKGFTLMEVLIVVAILSVLSIIIWSSFISFNRAQGLEKDTEMVVELLRQARSLTLNSQNASSYGVHISSHEVTLFAGTSYSSTDPANKVFPIQNTDTSINAVLTGGGANIIFNRLTGETDEHGTITLTSGSTARTQTITIFKTGLIEF